MSSSIDTLITVNVTGLQPIDARVAASPSTSMIPAIPFEHQLLEMSKHFILWKGENWSRLCIGNLMRFDLLSRVSALFICTKLSPKLSPKDQNSFFTQNQTAIQFLLQMIQSDLKRGKINEESFVDLIWLVGKLSSKEKSLIDKNLPELLAQIALKKINQFGPKNLQKISRAFAQLEMPKKLKDQVFIELARAEITKDASHLPPGYRHGDAPIICTTGKTIVNPMPALYRQKGQNLEKASKLFSSVLSCPPARNLLIKANSTKDQNGDTRPWELEFVSKKGPKKDDPKLVEFERESGEIFTLPAGSDACCNCTMRKITFWEGLPEDTLLTYFIFELTNALHSPKFIQIHSKTVKGDLDCEAYVKENERVEFEGTLMHHRILQVATQVHGWSKSLDIYTGYQHESEFEKYYLSFQDTPHPDYYRKGWVKITGKESEILKLKAPKVLSPEEQEKQTRIEKKQNLLINIIAIALMVWGIMDLLNQNQIQIPTIDIQM